MSNKTLNQSNSAESVPIERTGNPYELSSDSLPMSVVASTPISPNGGATFDTALALRFDTAAIPQIVPLETVTDLVPGGPAQQMVGEKQVNESGFGPVYVEGVEFNMDVHLSQDATTLAVSQHNSNIPALKVEWVIGLLDLDIDVANGE